LNSQARFISSPHITAPLVFLMVVVLVTARMTGGIGLHSLGNEVSGGRNYVLLLMAILGYFALTAKRIPPNRAIFYITIFYLSGCTSLISDLAPFVPSAFYSIFLFFPVSGYDLDTAFGAERHLRFAGLGGMGQAGFFCMLAVYGVRGIFLERKPWRLMVSIFFGIVMLFGGFRSMLILCGFIFVTQFYLERMQRTRLLPIFIFGGIILITLLVPFARKLPFTFQRSLAFLPLPISSDARRDAEATKDWRLQIWKDTLPDVPKYLLLGKGYALTATDLQFASSRNFRYLSDAEEVGIVGNYHSGPLSVVIPFGAWGIIGLLWFWGASLWALHKNYRNSDPKLKVVNAFLFAVFISKIILFIVVFGGFYGDMPGFAAIIGLSISLNGGVRRLVAKPAMTKEIQVARPVAPSFKPFLQR
jgi:hypothetical protein